MNSFTISQLQQFSGIKAHTIRMWEQRYNALNPNRTDGNTRYYDNSQLKRLLNIVSLMNTEFKVSELCCMSDDELFKHLDKQLNNTIVTDEKTEYFVSQLIASAVYYDEVHFEKIFSNAILRYGIKGTYEKVIYPLLIRIGLMWATSNIPPAQEHFISNLIRQKLFSAIDSLPPAKQTNELWLLLLPENEFHEISLLFAHYMLKYAGKKVIFLGCNVPIEVINSSFNTVKPTHLLFFLVHHNDTDLAQNYLHELRKAFPDTKIFYSGNEKLMEQLMPVINSKWVSTIQKLEEEL